MKLNRLGSFVPMGADVFVGGKSSECFDSPSEFVSADELGEVLTEAQVGFVVEALDGCFLGGSVQALELAVGPGVSWLGQAVVDVGFGAGEMESVNTEEPSLLKSVLGIDDWAWRKGHRCGTILCDLERGAVVDLLPDRDSESVQKWLRSHPGAEVISRDCASA